MANRTSIAAAPERLATMRAAISRALQGCRPETIEALIESGRVRTLQPGDLIYRQGDPVPFTLILNGYGIANRTTASGQELFSGVALPGVLFGYSAIASIQSTVGIFALTPGEVVQWPGDRVRELAMADAAFGLVAIRSLATSMHELMGQIEGWLHQDARRRVLRILNRYRPLVFGDAPILNRTHLPGLVGTSREMTGRVLRDLEREGTLRREGRNGLQLLQPERLEAAAV